MATKIIRVVAIAGLLVVRHVVRLVEVLVAAAVAVVEEIKYYVQGYFLGPKGIIKKVVEYQKTSDEN